MSDPTRQTDPIDREAERDLVQGSDLTADPLTGGEGSVIGATDEATHDHKIRSSQDAITEDIAAQRRDVVGFTHARHDPPGDSGDGVKGELERLAGNADGEVDMLSDAERVTLGMPDEVYAQPTAGAGAPADAEDYQPTANTGDKAAPMNQVPSLPDENQP